MLCATCGSAYSTRKIFFAFAFHSWSPAGLHFFPCRPGVLQATPIQMLPHVGGADRGVAYLLFGCGFAAAPARVLPFGARASLNSYAVAVWHALAKERDGTC